jgi:hypothetical protein
MFNQIFFKEIRLGPDGEIQEAVIEKPYARIIARRLVRRRADDRTPACLSRGQKRRNPDPFFGAGA